MNGAGIVTWRTANHTATKLLSTKCNQCLSDIDSGDPYFKWVGWVEGLGFYWYCKHITCHTPI